MVVDGGGVKGKSSESRPMAVIVQQGKVLDYIAGNQGLQKPEGFWELLKIIFFCKIHDERGSDEIQFYATAKERHGLYGRLKAKKGSTNCSTK